MDTLYDIRGDGRVWSNRRGRYLKLGDNGRGYKTFCHFFLGRSTFIKVHRAVAIKFVPNPNNKPFVNHIDGDKTNNNYQNLEWVTHSENIRHAYKTGLISNRKGFTHSQSKLNGEQVYEIKFKSEGVSHEALASKFGCTGTAISRIRKGGTWAHITVDSYS